MRRERAALRRWAVGLRGAGGRYAHGLLSGRAKWADAAWERRAGRGGRRAERASAGCSRGCWRGRKCASARGAGEGLVGGTGGRLEGDARASGGGPSAECGVSWAGGAALGQRGGEKKNWAARGTGPGREGEEEMAGWLLG